jgi:hypothetical protein
MNNPYHPFEDRQAGPWATTDHPKFGYINNLVLMHGREVVMRKFESSDEKFLPGLEKCSDCQEPTVHVVIELSIDPQPNHHVWGWCGICDIGA